MLEDEVKAREFRQRIENIELDISWINQKKKLKERAKLKQKNFENDGNYLDSIVNHKVKNREAFNYGLYSK